MVIINPQKCHYIFPRGCPCTNTDTHNCFMAQFPGLSRSAGARRDLLPDFVVQGKITEADTPTIQLGATPSGLISDPPPTSPPFLRRMPFLHKPFQFILDWDRHQICWLAYPVAWYGLYRLTWKLAQTVLVLLWVHQTWKQLIRTLTNNNGCG